MRRAITVLCLVAVVAPAAGEETAFVRKTYTYRTVDGVDIKADVWRADDTTTRPVIAWLHGGALIVGSRTSVPKNLLDLCKREGFALVSFDYRLAPEVKLPAIIEDVEAAFRWLREQGPKLLHIDPDRVVVAGGSAGGYLTLVTGYRVKPRPTALVAYWGYGDVDGEWYTKPSEHYRKQPLVPKDEAERAVGKGVLPGTEGDVGKARGRFYLYLRQNGMWTKEVTGFDHEKEKSKIDPYCPVRNVTAEYPPTMLVHGTEDTDVPYELSVAMDREFTRLKVPHELVTVKGAGHGLSGGDRKLVDEAHDKAVQFIAARLKEKSLRVVTLGDSITRGVRAGVKADETFAAVLDVELRKKGVAAEVVNVGIGGERTDQALKRLAKDVIERKPAVVTIMYGHNDSHVDVGQKAPRISADEYRANMKAIVAELKKAGIKPIVMTPPCYAKQAKSNAIGKHHNETLGQCAEICRELARELELPLVDHFSHWTKAEAGGVDLATWTTDLYHANPRGNQELAKVMLPVVLAQLRGESKP